MAHQARSTDTNPDGNSLASDMRYGHTSVSSIKPGEQDFNQMVDPVQRTESLAVTQNLECLKQPHVPDSASPVHPSPENETSTTGISLHLLAAQVTLITPESLRNKRFAEDLQHPGKQQQDLDPLRSHGEMLIECTDQALSCSDVDIPLSTAVTQTSSTHTVSGGSASSESQLQPSTAQQPIQCEQCEDVFVSQFSLGRHIRSAHPAHQHHYICGECFQSFLTQTRLDRHQRATHLDS